jgi:hypothetical protein
MSALQKRATVIFILALTIIGPGPARANEPFDIFVVPTIDEQLDSWLKIPARLQPTIHLVDRIYPNQPFSLRVLFRGYTLSALNNANLSYDVQIFDPQGQPTNDKGNNLLGYNGPVRGTGYIIINQQLLRIFFDISYAYGDYEIQVIATDQLAKESVSKSATITFAPFAPTGRFASLEFFNYWLRNHFRQPDIAKATFGILQFMEKDRQWMDDNIQLLAFMDRLLDDNRWLWDHLVAHYKEEAGARDNIITLMELNNYRLAELTTTFSQEQKAWQEQVRKFELPETGGPITTPGQIEALWGTFYATGHLASVEKIIHLLKPFTPTTGPATTSDLEQVAFWSLVDHGIDIDLVANFCSYLFDHGDIAPENKTQLGVILRLIEKDREEKEQQDSEADKKMPLSQPR